MLLLYHSVSELSEVITDSKAQRPAIILLCISDIDTMLVIDFETQGL